MRSLSSRERIYVVVFFLALAWGGWNYRHLFESGQAVTPSAQPVARAAFEVSVPAGSTNIRPAEAASSGVPEWGPDPFHRAWRTSNAAAGPPSSAKARKPGASLKLSAIVVRPDSRYAVINGGIVREGAIVAGRRVLRIESSRVVVDENGTEVTLSL